MQEEGHRLSVEVSGGRGQRCVDVGVGVNPQDGKRPDGGCVSVDGADGQTGQQMIDAAVIQANFHLFIYLFSANVTLFIFKMWTHSYCLVLFYFFRTLNFRLLTHQKEKWGKKKKKDSSDSDSFGVVQSPSEGIGLYCEN